MGKRYDYILEDVRKLCNYVLKYCDMQTGCEKCKLWGVGLDSGSQCPIYIMSMLDDALMDEGVALND